MTKLPDLEKNYNMAQTREIATSALFLLPFDARVKVVLEVFHDGEEREELRARIIAENVETWPWDRSRLPR